MKRTMPALAVLALALPAAGTAAATHSSRSAADYCKVGGHDISKSANGQNFLCTKAYFQGHSLALRGSYKRYGVAMEVINSMDESGYSGYYPSDPILTLLVSKRGRGVVYTRRRDPVRRHDVQRREWDVR